MRPWSRPLKAFQKSCGSHGPSASFYLAGSSAPSSPPSFKALAIILVQSDSKQTLLIIDLNDKRKWRHPLVYTGEFHNARGHPESSEGKRTTIPLQRTSLGVEGRDEGYISCIFTLTMPQINSRYQRTTEGNHPTTAGDPVDWVQVSPRWKDQAWWIKRLWAYRWDTSTGEIAGWIITIGAHNTQMQKVLDRWSETAVQAEQQPNSQWVVRKKVPLVLHWE